MADTREVVIKIVNADTQKKATDSPKKDVETQTQPGLDLQHLRKTVNTVAGVLHTKQLASYAYGKYTQLTENYISRNNVENATNMLGRFSTIAIQIGTGNYIGAIATAVGTGINIATNFANNFEQLDQKAYDKYYQGARMGLIDGNRGTEN